MISLRPHKPTAIVAFRLVQGKVSGLLVEESGFHVKGPSNLKPSLPVADAVERKERFIAGGFERIGRLGLAFWEKLLSVWPVALCCWLRAAAGCGHRPSHQVSPARLAKSWQRPCVQGGRRHRCSP